MHVSPKANERAKIILLRALSPGDRLCMLMLMMAVLERSWKNIQ
jgi:hypothetical protein